MITLTTDEALLAACALHLGFQAVVTAVVYPALFDVPTDRFLAAHAAHCRRITIVVSPVYALLAVSCLAVLVAGPRSLSALVSVAAAAVAAASTAFAAVPAHGRLARDGRSDDALRTLRVADSVRCAAAIVAAIGALVAQA